MARSSKRIKLSHAKSKPHQLRKQLNFASLPLEVRQMMLLEALKLGIPQTHTRETLIATVKSLVKVGFAFGQAELHQPLRELGRQLTRARQQAKDQTTQLLEVAEKTWTASVSAYEV